MLLLRLLVFTKSSLNEDFCSRIQGTNLLCSSATYNNCSQAGISKIQLFGLNLKQAASISWNLVKCSELNPRGAGQSLFCQAQNVRFGLGIWASFFFFFLFTQMSETQEKADKCSFLKEVFHSIDLTSEEFQHTPYLVRTHHFSYYYYYYIKVNFRSLIELDAKLSRSGLKKGCCLHLPPPSDSKLEA